MKLEQVLETCLYVNSLSEAETFYSDVLNLQLHSQQEERHLFYYCGAGMLLLFLPEISKDPESPLPPHGTVGSGHVAFSVPLNELSKWENHLLTHQVPIEQRVEWPAGGKSLYFRDPAGNSLEIASPHIWDKAAE